MTRPLVGARQRLETVDTLAEAEVDADVAARASVWLLRLAVEHALRDLWTARAPEVRQATMRAQLLVLPKYLGVEAAGRVGELWRALSRVAHHHPYELVPTGAEIVGWRQDAELAVRLIGGLADPQGPASRTVGAGPGPAVPPVDRRWR